MSNFRGKPFTDLLGEVENGEFLQELTEAMYLLVTAVRETRKAGQIAIAISVTPTGRESVDLDAKFKVKGPEHDRPSTTFFVNKDGTLLRNDPNQPRLPLREVDVPANEPIDVTAKG